MTAGLGALDLASVRALNNINDVNRLLHEANTKERSIDAELEQLLSRRGQLEDSLLTLHDATTEVCGDVPRFTHSAAPHLDIAKQRGQAQHTDGGDQLHSN